MEHAASFTGHRPRVGMAFDLRSARTEMLERHLDRAVELLVRQQDVRYFLCGMASGFDLFAAQRVLRLRRSGVLPESVSVVAVLPYPDHSWDISGERWKRAYQEVLQELGRPSPRIDPALEHILITGMFHTFFELVIHEMPLGDAENYVREMRAFYTAGWMKIMGQ